MSVQTIKKAFGLLIIDFVIIIGIFVLQFRTDSNIIEKIGNLQITYAKEDSQNSELILKNKLKISYNGINYFFDEQNPAKILRKGGDEIETVSLLSLKKIDSFSYNFIFENDIEMMVALASDVQNAELMTVVHLPEDISNFYLPYNFGYGMKISKEENNKVIFEGKKIFWEMSVPSFKDNYVAFDHMNRLITYGVHNDVETFTFDSLVDVQLADSGLLETNIQNLKNQLISVYKANTSEVNVSEQTVVSYIAASAEKGNYVSAVEEVSQTYRKSVQRTYLSAPYLDSLSVMNNGLEQILKDNENQITKASYSGSLDLFTVRNLAAFLCIHPNTSAVEKLLSAAASVDISEMQLSVAVGIIQTYNDLYKYNKKYADLLLPVLDDCILRITSDCKYDGNILTISENDTFLSVIQAVETGVAVMRYGIISGDEVLQKAGNVIINSYISDSSVFDLRTLSNIYPIIAYDNWYYPHFLRVKTYDNQLVWAWTCAKDITYTKQPDGGTSFTIDFPEGYTHYVIIKGVPVFRRIYIYNTLFRTDPRFETYNSSGYIYKADTNTLLLKSRHKSRLEEIRFEYAPKETSKPVVTETVAETKNEKKVTETAATTPVSPQTSAPVAENKTTDNSNVQTQTQPVQPIVNSQFSQQMKN